MIERNRPDINLDELMQKIRAEVQERREKSGPLEPSGFAFRPHTQIDPARMRGAAGEPFHHKEEGYHLNEFLKYHDEHFVMNAYQGILRRTPDSEALQYFLENLRSGNMTKAEVLGRLRYAPEGRAKKVPIKGLFWHFLIQSSFRIPILGYVCRWTFGILNLPRILRNLQILEGNSFMQLAHQRQDLMNSLKQIETALGAKAGQAELNGFRREVEASLAGKAGHEDLRKWRAELEKVLETKVGRGELREVSEAKADQKDLAMLAETKVNQAAFEGLNRAVRDLKLNVMDQQHRLKMLLEEARKRLPEPISTLQMEKMLVEEDHILDALYVSLEDRERGSRQDIKQRLEYYLPYVQKAGAGTMEYPLIDVGCGRGEWLEILKENGFVARGVDMNRVMQRDCEELGLDVAAEDAVIYLRGLKPNSVGAVTGFHIVEHLPTRTMLLLFSEVLRVLKPGGIVIFETPNPENIFVGSCTFYTDPTHRNPIPPNTLAFLMEYQGFVEPEIVRLNPLNAIEYNQDDGLKDLVYRFNMGQDYAVIARKAS